MGLFATSFVVVAALFSTPIAAQSSLVTSAPASSASVSASASASAQTHTISVGIDHKFKPEVTQAEAGDLIEFLFFPPNHSVVRAEYEFPCIPYEMTGRGKKGFFSGFHPVDAILPDPPKYTLKINDTDPVFFYCSAPGSCIGYGMVGVINPNATTSLEVQRQTAKKASYMLNPGEPFPPEGPPESLSVASSPSSTSTSSSETSSSSTSPSTNTAVPASTSSNKSSSGLSKGAIAGIAVAGVAILALAAALFYFIGRSKTMNQELKRSTTAMHSHSGSTYLNPYFPGPKSDVSNEPSGGASVPGVGPHGGNGGPPYEYGAGVNPLVGRVIGDDGRGEQKPEYWDSNGVGGGRGYSYGNQERLSSMSPPPRRHPSVLLNPNDPREMDVKE